MNPKLTCEEARMLASRNLDGDLARQEAAPLLAHLAACGDCRSAAAEMALLESATQDVSRLYSAFSLSPEFAADLQKGLPPRNPSFHMSSFFKGLKGMVATRAFAAVAGALISLALFVLLFLPAVMPVNGQARFTLHPIAFHAATDRLDWHHRKKIPPGDAVRLVVHTGDENPYHMKIESPQALAKIEIVHEAAGGSRAVHQVEFHGARYASLASPASGDVLVARNVGQSAVILKAHTVESGNATMARYTVRQFNSNFSELLAVRRY